jgi:hypothetical protein
MRAPDLRRQDGASLVIVLVFITVFGMIIGGLLTEAGASIKYSTTVNAHEQRVYAADAGVSLGIQQLHQNNETCAGAGSIPIPDTVVNGRTVSVTCSVSSGSNSGGSGFAVITTSTGAGSLSFSNAQQKKIGGPVYVSGGVSWGPGVAVTNGNFYQLKPVGACPTPPTSGQLSISGPFGYYCTTTARPDPPHNPPPKPTVTNPAYTDIGSCRVFYPGIYTTVPSLTGGDNYFASGVYYFNFSSTLNVNKATVYGGQPDPAYESRAFTPAPACAQSDSAYTGHTGVGGTGVEWIFGGTSNLYVDNQGGVELFARTGDIASSTSRVSMVAVPNEPAWTNLYAANTLPATTNIVDIKNGSKQDLAVHGLLYAPNQSTGLTATNAVLAQILGGLVTYSLNMQSSASAQGLAVSIEGGAPNPRHTLITATAHGINGERDEVSTAVVRVDNDDARTITVESWRTRGPSDPT